MGEGGEKNCEALAVIENHSTYMYHTMTLTTAAATAAAALVIGCIPHICSWPMAYVKGAARITVVSKANVSD